MSFPGTPRQIPGGETVDLRSTQASLGVPIESASERGSQATRAIVEAGRRAGFAVETEYAVPGGRVDVVWFLASPETIPAVPDRIPVIGFEIESSWRTRKQVKGDLMNLQDLSPALGVIVLLGEGGKVESLRRFATDLVARSLQRAVVWTDEDLNRIARPDANPVGAAAPNPEFAGEKGAAPAVAPREHTGKYRRLWLWLISQSDSEIQTSFDELEQVIGTSLPDSCRKYAPSGASKPASLSWFTNVSTAARS